MSQNQFKSYPYPCLFCPNKELMSTKNIDFIDFISQTNSILTSGYYVHYGYCKRCCTNYQFDTSEDHIQLVEYSFNTVYKQITYTAIFHPINKQFILKTVMGPTKIIANFNYLPDITPYNLYAKMSMLLVFS